MNARLSTVSSSSKCKYSTSAVQYNVFSSSSSSNDDASVTPESILDHSLKIRESIQEVNDKYKGPLEKAATKNTILPFVFLLGNHSAGKSSFINYVLNRKVQTSGVAPTDDAFTIIVPGPADVDRDGPSFIGDPDMGFSGLRTFGPNLIHHTSLKVRSGIAIKNFMIVDTPGMIDSPLTREVSKGGSAEKLKGFLYKQNMMDRGYDFESVCRWYAERADVILLFFDPDKPGTTGETLQILTNSLVGLDHKLHIILNKADQFKKIHDFARAYGSLCWNLSKVIQRKDLPRIYTMCLPKAYQASSWGKGDSDEETLGKGLIDLEVTREEVVQEVMNAPKRRVDNEISRLTDAVGILHMHLTVVEELSKQYRTAIFRDRLSLVALVLGTGVSAVGTFMLGIPIQIPALIAGVGILGGGGLSHWQSKRQIALADDLLTEPVMNLTFKKLYSRSVADKDEFTMSIWRRVQDHILISMSSSELTELPKVDSSEIQRLQKIMDLEIPNLRRMSAPVFNKKI